MSAPEPDRAAARRGGRGKDLSAVPAFLRASTQGESERAGTAPKPGPALSRPVTPAPTSAPQRQAPTLDPASLPMPSLSRRRVVTVAGILVAGLLALSFAQQVGEATAASDYAEQLRAGNAALKDDVERLQHDLAHVQDPRFIELEGRGVGLGGPREVPFALAAGAPPLAADAPGSASVRLGADPPRPSPIDAWLEVLFGTSS